MKKYMFLIMFCLVSVSAFAQTQLDIPLGTVDGVGPVSFPSEQVIWMFVTLAAMKFLSTGLLALENYILNNAGNWLLRGFAYAIKGIRSAINQMIANTPQQNKNIKQIVKK